MRGPFIGSDHLAARGLTRGQLRWNFTLMFPDVYVPKAAKRTLLVRTRAAWLWSGREGVIAGRAAAALHGAGYVDDGTPIELIVGRSRSPAGIVTRNERIDADEIMEIDGMCVTTPARTAVDLARHLPRNHAVRHLDALAHATDLTSQAAVALVDRHPRARGIRRAGVALDLMDGGAQSPRETWLRLLYVDAGFPRPATQVRVSDGWSTAFLDLGWEGPMVSAEYDGDRHQLDRKRYVHDIGRNELVRQQGWLDVHVVAEHSPAYVLRRTADAFARRGHPLRLR
ncbi:type IV toxin-antitoxin system AbiEi family antitoxin [Mycolicibacterium grossiae]|uniref:AbiEi antitoxin C-terminal domain-containing protein n=1 Tax=Mycolicibacterium grossiae TaxID=1552759 RepID=A0A1E8QAV5_9MYCO|nr:type IV toxin-antitoxin system AbiEi family antitoxin [Mycolicibacterium grossiae]OFJ55747.1 hypothetical protein BEL07_00685 [Mycolicibacterium grossiae]QEM43408.1 hypothetical protein FZ046_00220 [Mycolicibacterium grossiae]